jgi:hypothetical protein
MFMNSGTGGHDYDQSAPLTGDAVAPRQITYDIIRPGELTVRITISFDGVRTRRERVELIAQTDGPEIGVNEYRGVNLAFWDFTALTRVARIKIDDRQVEAGHLPEVREAIARVIYGRRDRDDMEQVAELSRSGGVKAVASGFVVGDRQASRLIAKAKAAGFDTKRVKAD